MANGLIQLIGEFKASPTGSPLVDYSAFVTRASVSEQRNTVTLPAPLSTALETESAGTTKRTLTIVFHSTTAAASLYGMLKDVINNDDALFDWSVKENDTAISADNPVYSGTAMLPMIDGMPDVGALRQRTVTCPITIYNTPDITP